MERPAPLSAAPLLILALVACRGDAGAAPAPAVTEPQPACARVDRRVRAMGTELAITIAAPTRPEALAASEAVVRAVESAERRLSTWRSDSELAALNRAAPGEPVDLSRETMGELRAAWRWTESTQGAFDPAVGALARAWDLRGSGRIPTTGEIAAARIPGGLRAALALGDGTATRLDPRLCLEEGGFGKGAGLDAALVALAGTEACGATLDFGGQVAWYAPAALERAPSQAGSEAKVADLACAACSGTPERSLDLADPADRARRIATLRTRRASAATSGNSEHARQVDGRSIGHLLDPRTGAPAADFGSVTVLADSAIDADCLSTGLFVLGPERALAFAAQRGDLDVVVVERLDGGRLRLRASSGVVGSIEPGPDVDFDRAQPDPAHRSPSPR